MEIKERPIVTDTPEDLDERRFRWAWFYTQPDYMVMGGGIGFCKICINDPPKDKAHCMQRHTAPIGKTDIGFPMPRDIA